MVNLHRPVLIYFLWLDRLVDSFTVVLVCRCTVDLSEPFAQLMTNDLEERLAAELAGAQPEVDRPVCLREDAAARVQEGLYWWGRRGSNPHRCSF